MRRYDIDWLRVLALGLLIIYHAVAAFQPWAYTILFPQNKELLEWLWVPMSLINIWRIPILFIISGMGVGFAIKRRNWKELLKDRTKRIFVPYIFGFFIICPINIYIASIFYNDAKLSFYIPNPGHLWFLGNIFTYVLLFLPLLVFWNNNSENIVFRILKKAFQNKFGIYVIALPFLFEALLFQTDNYSGYAQTFHGFILGLICFLIGFIFISLGNIFWKKVEEIKKVTLIISIILYLVRLLIFELEAPAYIISIESISWMLSIFGYGSKFLNKPSKKISYLSHAVYPIYILHMPFQYLASLYILPLNLSAIIKLLLLVIVTFLLSLFLYEFVIKRFKLLRPLFGLVNK